MSDPYETIDSGMEISKHSGEKVDDYFERLRQSGVSTGDLHQEISRAAVELVLASLGIGHNDMKDVRRMSSGAC